jgi:hypothetical protein
VNPGSEPFCAMSLWIFALLPFGRAGTTALGRSVAGMENVYHQPLV